MPDIERPSPNPEEISDARTLASRLRSERHPGMFEPPAELWARTVASLPAGLPASGLRPTVSGTRNSQTRRFLIPFLAAALVLISVGIWQALRNPPRPSPPSAAAALSGTLRFLPSSSQDFAAVIRVPIDGGVQIVAASGRAAIGRWKEALNPSAHR